MIVNMASAEAVMPALQEWSTGPFTSMFFQPRGGYRGAQLVGHPVVLQSLLTFPVMCNFGVGVCVWGSHHPSPTVPPFMSGMELLVVRGLTSVVERQLV